MAQARIPKDDIVAALTRWEGNVKAAAEDLGIRRRSLYERIERSQLDLDAFRPSKSEVPMPAAEKVSVAQIQAALQASDGNIVAASNELGVSAKCLRKRITAYELAEIRTRANKGRRVSRNLTLRPEMFDLLREAKFDLAARLRIELTEVDVLKRFMADRFEGWLQEQLGGRRLMPAETSGGGLRAMDEP